MKFENIVNKIDSLPALSDTSIIVQQLYAEGAENVDIIKLVRAIESDALLAANILKMINSPLYGFSKKIASVSQAVTLFGTQIIYGLVVSFSINSVIKANLRPYGISNQTFNDICLIQSALMTQWYSKIDLRHAQFLAPLALIMESGKLVVANEVASSLGIKEFSNGLRESKSVVKYENAVIQTSSYYVSGLLFDYWNLEPLYVDMLKGLDFEYEPISDKIDNYIDTLDVVRTAVNVKAILSDESIKEASAMVAEMGLDSEHFEHIAHRIKDNYLKKQH